MACLRVVFDMSTDKFGTSASLFWHAGGRLAASARHFGHFGASCKHVGGALLQSSLSNCNSCSKHLDDTVSQLRRDSFTRAVLAIRRVSPATRSCHFGASLFSMSAELFTILYFQILYLPRTQSISAVQFYNFGASLLTRQRHSFATSVRQS